MFLDHPSFRCLHYSVSSCVPPWSTWCRLYFLARGCLAALKRPRSHLIRVGSPSCENVKILNINFEKCYLILIFMGKVRLPLSNETNITSKWYLYDVM